MAKIVFTDAAIEDLRRLGPSIAPRVLKKILILETDSEAGASLGGDLVGYRKLVVGNRDWRVIYRIDRHDRAEVCEMSAAGARSDSATYREAMARLKQAAASHPELVPLHDVCERLGRLARGIDLAEEAPPPEPVPDWLAESLVRVARVAPAEVAALDARQAFERWNEFLTRPTH